MKDIRIRNALTTLKRLNDVYLWNIILHSDTTVIVSTVSFLYFNISTLVTLNIVETSISCSQCDNSHNFSDYSGTELSFNFLFANIAGNWGLNNKCPLELMANCQKIFCRKQCIAHILGCNYIIMKRMRSKYRTLNEYEKIWHIQQKCSFLQY